MGASRVDRCWEQYLNSGRVTVGASVVKAVLAMFGMSLLALMAAAYATAAFLDDGAAALKGWVCVLLVAVCFLGDGGDSVDVRVVLTPQGRVAHGGEEQRGYVDLPSGFRISKKNLVALMERIRLSRV